MKSELRLYFEVLSKYLKPLKFKVILLAIILAISIGLQLITPQILGFFIDSAKGGGSIKTLLLVALSFIGVAILQQLFTLLSTYISQVVGGSSTNQLKIDLLEKSLSLDMGFHKKHKQGTMIERIDGDTTALFNFFSNLMPKLLNNIVLMIGILIILYRENILIGIPISIFVIVAMSIFTHIQKKAIPVWGENREITSEFYGLLGENIDNSEDIRSSGAIGYFMYRFHKFLRKFYAIQVKSEMMFFKIVSSSLIIIALGSALSLGVGGYLWTKGIISIGTVYMVFRYTELLRQPIEQIRGQLQELQRAGASVKRVQELIDTESQLADGNEELTLDSPLEINVNNVSFQYEDGNYKDRKYEEGKQVLNNISFKLPKGKILGLLGRTGSGKTTLARLIARLYDPQHGEIQFNGENINNLKLENLRKYVAYVTQDVQIFCATVRDNITFFNPEIKDEDILNIINDIGLNDWFEKLPQGLDTMLQAEGGGLSAGETQLLAFIRVFLREPSLVIMDEASSRLDSATERLIEKALQKLLKDRTCIIIAHKLETIERADDILILDNGTIIEHGNREKLLKDKNSKFSELLEKGIEEVLD